MQKDDAATSGKTLNEFYQILFFEVPSIYKILPFQRETSTII